MSTMFLRFYPFFDYHFGYFELITFFHSMNSTALICIGMLGVLLFCLGFAVSALRGVEKKPIGCSDDPTNTLYKFVRAHANTAEYAPLLAVLFLVVGLRAPDVMQQSLMIIATASRYVIVYGLVASPTMAKTNPARFIGGMGTYLAGIALSVILLVG